MFLALSNISINKIVKNILLITYLKNITQYKRDIHKISNHHMVKLKHYDYSVCSAAQNGKSCII